MFPLVGIPPPLRSCALSWRQLYEMGCFFQRELVLDSELGSEARKRGFHLGQVGREQFERWDKVGALRPIAFAKTAYISGSTSPALPPDHLVFRDEVSGFEPWDSYAWDAWGHPHVSAMFSPWQLLVLPDAVEGGSVPVDLEFLVETSGQVRFGESPQAYFQAKYEQWTSIHGWWDPTLRLLVRLQNRYWPQVRGTMNVVSSPDGGWYEPDAEGEFDAGAVLDELQVTAQDIVDAHKHFCQRAHALEFGDDAYLLRQMFPRPRRQRFEKLARRAQDFYDATEVLRLFHRELTGDALPDAEVMTLGHTDEGIEMFRQRRKKLFGHETRVSYDSEDAKQVLGSLGVYPHGVHVIVEGESEETVVSDLVEEVLGTAALDDLVVTNLRGVGAGPRIEKLLSAVSDYALRTVLIVDDEGEMRAAVDQLLADGSLQAEDVLVQATSLEESNFTDDELVEIAVGLASTPGEKRPAATLKLSGTELRAYHDDRLRRSSDEPGLANSLTKLAAHEEHGSVRFSKLELAEAIMSRLKEELAATSNWDELEEVAKKRSVLNHIFQRIIKPLAETAPDRLPRRR